MARPRKFDREEVLEKASKHFLANGFEGSSIDQLSSTMGMSLPSIYGAFGNKEGLFFACLERYSDYRDEILMDALSAPDIRIAIRSFLTAAARLQTREEYPAGCFFVQTALVTGEANNSVSSTLAEHRSIGLKQLELRLERARLKGQLPASTDVLGLARFFTAVMQGMAVQASGGATIEQLEILISHAMNAWPDDTPQ